MTAATPAHDITADRQFIPWLQQEQISLACTTYQTSRLMLLGVNPETEGISGFERIFDRAMGLYGTTERLYLSSKYQIWQLDNVLSPGQNYNGYDKLYIPRLGYTTGDLDVHDLAVDSKGRLVFIASILNCLATVSDRHSCQPLWKPPFISQIINEDRCHLNGLAMVKGQPRYVTAVSRSDIVDGWRDRRESGGVVIDINSNEVVATGLSMPHSPRWYQDKLWVLNSGRGELGYIDLATGKFEAVAFCPGYLRGLAFWGNYAIAGLSKPRGGDKTFSGLPLDELLAKRDADPRCGLVVVDLKSGAIVHWLRFEGVVTELYDVQVIPGVKRPMALGFQTEEIAQLITLEPLASINDNSVQDSQAELKSSSSITSISKGKKVISFSLWGNNPRYTVGAIKNADLALKIYPGWICRFYINNTVPLEIVQELSSRNHVEVIEVEETQPWQGLFWRFYPASDPDVAIMISRDADSRLNQREKAAVEDWLASDRDFHLMRDHPRHKLPILGGMWGIKGNKLDLVKLISEYLKKHSDLDFQYGIDQHFLAEVIYPRIKDNCLVHDEIFEQKPFPLARQNYEYVGQVFLADDSTSKETDEVLKQYLLTQGDDSISSARQIKPSDSDYKGFGNKVKKKPKKEKVKTSPSSSSSHPVKPAANPSQALLERSRIWKQEGNLAEAELCLREAISLDANNWAAYNNLGTLVQNQGNLVEAKTCYQKALQLQANFAEAISNLASIWQLEEDVEKAKTGFYRALQLKPDYLPAHFNLAHIFQEQRRMAAAIEHFQKVVELDPNYIEAYFSLGGLYEYQRNFTRALECYEQVEKLNPDAYYVKSFINYIYLKLCHWEGYEERNQEVIRLIEAHVKNPKSIFTPFALSAFPVPLSLHQALAKTFASQIIKGVAATKERLQLKHRKSKPQKLRLGYISPDFRNHAVGRLIYQIFEHHNREQFEVYGYSTVDVEDHITQKVRSGCDVFVDLSPLSTEAAARRIYSDGIHILIDLAGYTIGHGASILALQPAPIQAQFMGYPDTMGAEFIQYAIADSWLITPEIAQSYTEEIIYLPHAFVASPLKISPKPMTRAEFGLPEEAFVCCCFNSHYKINPPVFDVWMNILHQVPHAVLWLSGGSETVEQNLRKEAKKRDIKPERIIFAAKLPQEEYLARYALADLYLDTFIYNAGSTAAAVLWAGLPLLTCAGPTNASRMGASICAAAGFEEMICENVSDYEQRAVYLATHPQELAEIGHRLKQKLQSPEKLPPLFDVKRFVDSLESALQLIWQN